MSGMFWGSSAPTALKWGGADVSEVYYGSTKIWPVGAGDILLSSLREPENGGHLGPFHKSIDDHYKLGLSQDSRTLHIIKAANNTPADGDWINQDSVLLTTASDCGWVWGQMSGDGAILEILTYQYDGDVRSHIYTTASETFTTTNVLAAAVSGTPTDPYSGAAVTPVGAFVIEDSGDLAGFMLGKRASSAANAYYRLLRNGGSWVSPVLLNATANADNGTFQGCVNGGTADGANFCWSRNSVEAWRVRISLGTSTDTDQVLAAVPGLFSIGPGILDEESPAHAWFPFVNDATSELGVVHWEDTGDSDTAIFKVEGISDQGAVDNAANTNRPWPCVHLGWDGVVPHAFYSAANGDLYWNKDASITGGAEVLLVSGIDCWNLGLTYDSFNSKFWVGYTNGDRAPIMAFAVP